MSLRQWSSVKDRTRFKSLLSGTILAFEIREIEGLLRQVEQQDDDDDSMSSVGSVDTDSSVESSNDDLFPEMLCVLSILQHDRTYKQLEDVSVDWGRRLKVADINESDCDSEFRFQKDDLQEVADALWPRLQPYLGLDPEAIECKNRFKCPCETMLLLLLFRLARPRRIRPDMEKYFGMRRTHVGVALDKIQLALKLLAVQCFDEPRIFAGRVDCHALKVHDKCGGLMRHAWGFIDGTLRKTCRPTHFQKRTHSGHKRCHGLKFQSVTVPDGLMACLYGPINGNRHDSYMLAQSQLLLKLRLMMPPLPGARIYSLYGDPLIPRLCTFLEASATLLLALWRLDGTPKCLECASLWNGATRISSISSPSSISGPRCKFSSSRLPTILSVRRF